LDLCGGTGSWSKPYAEAGYTVHLITLPEFDITRSYVENGVIYFPRQIGHALEVPARDVYGVLAAPPCTKFSKAAWSIKKADRDFREGMRCVRACIEIIWGIQENGAPLAFWALENPMGYLYNFLGQPAYYFQPWWFREIDGKRTKRTALWGYFNKPRRTVHVRDFPYISSHSRPAGDGTCDRERLNKHWGRMSAEERAETSEYFARAFFEANNFI